MSNRGPFEHTAPHALYRLIEVYCRQAGIVCHIVKGVSFKFRKRGLVSGAEEFSGCNVGSHMTPNMHACMAFIVLDSKMTQAL